MLLGYFWHLLLDELNSVESTGTGRVRLKRSFGTALKFFGQNPLANLCTYAVLCLVAYGIYYEPICAQRAGNFVDSIRRSEFWKTEDGVSEDGVSESGGKRWW